MKEFEIKRMLSEETYNHLRKHWEEGKPPIIQTNYYFDTDDLVMNRQGITCRIRLKDGIYKATVKSHGIKGSNCSFEEDLSEKTYLDPEVFSSRGLHLQGELITERVILFKDKVCEIMLDRNSYLSVVDYELEIEYLEGWESSADRMFDEIAKAVVFFQNLSGDMEISHRHGKSKSERFFEKLKKDFQP